MKPKILSSLCILLCISLLACIGCSSLVDRITPADVSNRVPEYIGQESKDFYSLHDIKTMQEDMAIHHRTTQLELLRLTEDDALAFQDAKGFIETAIQEAERFQAKVIGDNNNPLSIAGLLFALTGGLVGRSYFRRPGDLTLDEARAKGASV